MPERRGKGQSGRLRDLAIQSGMTPEAFDDLTPKERRRLHTELTAGTGKNKPHHSALRDGAETRGRHGMNASTARRRY